LLETIVPRILFNDAPSVAIGLPCEVRDGVVLDGANLTRPAGPGTPSSTALVEQWRDFDAQSVFAQSTKRDVRVVNDATLALLGCMQGVGREMVMTLGTGCGFSLSVDGELTDVPDIGDRIFDGGATFDSALGERGRKEHEPQWVENVVAGVVTLHKEYGVDLIHLAGGNARRLSPRWFGSLGKKVRIEGNEVALRAGARLF
jgi:polyphosphate glucokinase